MQPEFNRPEFLEGNSAEEIHERMMNNLPDDIDDMPGGFPYDMTMPAALEKDEIINFHIVRALMISFPEYAWDEWLDLHGRQVHLTRHEAEPAFGYVKITAAEGTEILSGTVFCTAATETGPSIEYATTEDAVVGGEGAVLIPVSAVEAGTGSNVAANTVALMMVPNKNVTEINNPEPIRGGTERETDDDFYDRIAAEYDNSMTYLGNDTDYKRWAKQAGAGDAIVIPAWNGPGTVKLVLVDGNGKPANAKLVQDVYNYIVSPNDRSARLLPTGTAELTCVAATTVAVNYVITGLSYNETRRMDKDDADGCRTRILRFADELRRDVKHSEEFFNQILDDISDYERYCTEHPEYKNSKAVNAIAEIDKVYQKCMEKNSFL